MDGSTPGTNPPFAARRWRRQFAVAHLQDLVRDWQNPQPGPDEVLAAMRAAPVAPLQGEPFGRGMGALLEVDPGLLRPSRTRNRGPHLKKSELEDAYQTIRDATPLLDTLSVGSCSGCEDLAEKVATNKSTCEARSGCTFSLSGCTFTDDGGGNGRCVCNYTCTGSDCKSQVEDGLLQGACKAKMIDVTVPAAEPFPYSLPPEEDAWSQGCIKNESDYPLLAVECHDEGYPMDFYLIDAHDTSCGRSDDDFVLVGPQWYKVRTGVFWAGTVTNTSVGFGFCKVSAPCVPCGH